MVEQREYEKGLNGIEKEIEREREIGERLNCFKLLI